MNSEELEASLRAEFENYLKSVLSEMRQEVAEFQKKFDAEFERQRAEFNNAIASLASRFESESTFDEAFRSSVAEHLRLARDEGAKLTATAFAEAEKLEMEAAPPSFDRIRDAVNDISSQDSQSAILKSLVQQAAMFAPRGAFFVVKNDHFVGWKVFGSSSESAENAIREIHFPVSEDSILGTVVRTMNTVDSAAGAHTQDVRFLEPLGFGRPDRMLAIPLAARGKVVAVLYADYGDDGVHLNREAIETLVRVAGLTVETRAIAKSESQEYHAATTEFDETQYHPEPESESAATPFYREAVQEIPSTPDISDSIRDDESAGFTFNESPEYIARDEEVPETAAYFDAVPVQPLQEDQFVSEESVEEWPAEEHSPVETPLQDAVTEAGMVFDSGGSIEPAGREASPFEATVEDYAPAAAHGQNIFEPAGLRRPDPAPQPVSMPEPQSRLSDRPVDLPIDVPEGERRLHNDARRFARLLVSEIKLYNEKKVAEGRESGDLYSRLKDAIDRSREMYDKRVQPPVASKFDYFHYEIVNSLADGSSERLGPGYPGGSV